MLSPLDAARAAFFLYFLSARQLLAQRNFPMATGAQIKAEVELMLDEQDDEPLRMSELQRELERRLGLEPGSMKEHKSVLLKIVEKIQKRRARARKKSTS